MGGRSSYKSLTKKAIVDYFLNNLICRCGVLESIITDNGANLNIYLIRDICDQFKITHQNSSAYRLQMNGAVHAANKNIKWGKWLTSLRLVWDVAICFIGYRMSVRTLIGAALYLHFCYFLVIVLFFCNYFIYSYIPLVMNYVWPEFSRMRYVGSLCQLRHSFYPL